MFSAFTVLSFVLLTHHEPWRDEAQAWLIVRDSPDFASMINLMGYEHTPALWHVVLFPFVKSGLPYSSMAYVHIILILMTVYLFIQYSPFSNLQKVLFVFGYYPLYEYNVIARSYVLSVLLLFLLAHAYGGRFKCPIYYSALLFLLANTNAYSLIISIVFSGFYLGSMFHQRIPTASTRHRVSLLIISAGFIVSVYQVMPPADLIPALVSRHFNLDGSGIIRALNGAFIPILSPQVNFWGHLMLQNPPYSYVGLILFAVSVMFFIRSPAEMLAYLMSCLGLLCVFGFVYTGSLRHHGLIFILFVTLLWMTRTSKESKKSNGRLIRFAISPRVVSLFLSTFFLLQIISSPIAVYYEFNYDFSAGKRAAEFLETNNLLTNRTFIASHSPSVAVSSILPYTPGYPRFYYIEYNDWRSFMLWNRDFAANSNLPLSEVTSRLELATHGGGYDKVLVIDGGCRMSDDERYYPLAKFRDTIAGGEGICIYQLMSGDSNKEN